MEAHFKTEQGASLIIGGIPDPKAREVHFALKIPYGLSILATNDPHAEVKGLVDLVPDDKDWPDVVLTHLSFQTMVGSGFALLGLSAWFWWMRWRRPGPESRRLLWALVVGSPLGFLALEAGWLVTELGRQPWTIGSTDHPGDGVMRTAEAVTTSPDVVFSFVVFTVLYLLLGVALIGLLRQLARRRTKDEGQSTKP
jgi:cytochrome d ubiquinol oxidase subunit I